MCDNCTCEKKELHDAINELVDIAIEDKLLQWKLDLLEYINKRYEKKIDFRIEKVR